MSKVGTKSKVSKWFYQNGESVVITSDIWERDPYYKKSLLPHIGYDYRARTPLNMVAALNGVIVQIVTGWWSDYGWQIFLYDEEKNVTVHYAHLSEVHVKVGQRVKQGDLIGVTGATGKTKNAYDAHLHLGLAKGKVTTTTKGKALGDIWLDVEEFDFNPKPKLTDKEIAYEIVFGKNVWGDGEARKNALGSRYAGVQAEANKMVGAQTVVPKPQAPKPQALKDEYVTVGGRKTLYKASTGSSHYGAKVQSLKSRKMKVLDRKNGRVQVYSKGVGVFDVDSFWVVV